MNGNGVENYNLKINSRSVTFDLVNLDKTTVKQSDDIIYTAKEKGTGNGLTIGFLQRNNEIVGALMVELNHVDNYRTVDYYSVVGDHLSTVTFDEVSGKVEIKNYPGARS